MIREWTGPVDLEVALGSELRRAWPDRWVRFYTLPGGERIARDRAQREEQLHRYLQVLGALGEPVLVTSVGALGFEAAVWRTVAGDPELTLYASEVEEADDLVPLLELIADDRAHDVIVASRDLSWMVHPYDGGIDVISGRADELRQLFAEWVSPRADGL